MNQNLVDMLSDVGKPTDIYQSPDGTEVLILPYGGRILGLFAHGSTENFYWTHLALESPASAREFYGSQQWHNSGGDRTWLAPEVDFFFPHFPQTDVYFQPRQLDPGDWKRDTLVDAPRLVNRLTCRLSRSQTDVEMEITKSVSPALNPLRHELVWEQLEDVQYAGYALRTSLELLGGEYQQQGPVGLWNLVQMPHGGDMLIPVCCRSEPRILFGDVPTDDLEVSERLIRYAMRAPGEQKLAVRAASATGRIGYRYAAQDGRWALIVRNVFVIPSGQYVDVPWTDVEDQGYAIQACNIHSQLGSFSELEYHVPAIGAGTGRASCEDVSQTWAFRGPRGAIDVIAKHLIGTET